MFRLKVRFGENSRMTASGTHRSVKESFMKDRTSAFAAGGVQMGQ